MTQFRISTLLVFGSPFNKVCLLESFCRLLRLLWSPGRGFTRFRGCYHGLRRGLLLVVKLILLFFSSTTLSKIAHIFALTASIFIKLSLFESLAQALYL